MQCSFTWLDAKLLPTLLYDRPDNGWVFTGRNTQPSYMALDELLAVV